MMYNKRQEAVVSINGWMIRPCLGPRNRVWFQVDGTGHKFETLEGAEQFAETLLPRRSNPCPI